MTHDALAGLNLVRELSRDELGTRLNSLRDAQGKLDGVNYIEKTVDIRLVESPERCDRHSNVLSELFTVMQKVGVELENNKESPIQTKNEIASPNQN